MNWTMERIDEKLQTMETDYKQMRQFLEGFIGIEKVRKQNHIWDTGDRSYMREVQQD